MITFTLLDTESQTLREFLCPSLSFSTPQELGNVLQVSLVAVDVRLRLPEHRDELVVPGLIQGDVLG